MAMNDVPNESLMKRSMAFRGLVDLRSDFTLWEVGGKRGQRIWVARPIEILVPVSMFEMDTTI